MADFTKEARELFEAIVLGQSGAMAISEALRSVAERAFADGQRKYLERKNPYTKPTDVEDNADNRDADAQDLALAGAEAMKRYALLEEALCWLPPGTVVEYHGDLDGFLEEVRALGWEPGGGNHAP